jgi:hypothetical protein
MSWGNRKPPMPCSINWGHPLANGLIACFLCNEMGGPLIDLVSGNRITLVNAGVRGSFQFGYGLNCNGSDAGCQIPAWDKLKEVSQECTMLWRGQINTGATNNAGLFGVNYNSGGTSPFNCYHLYLPGGSSLGAAWNAGGANNTLTHAPTNAFDNTERQVVGVIRGLSGGNALYENLVQLTTSSGSFGPSYTSTSPFSIGTFVNGAGTNSKSTFRHGYIWKRGMDLGTVQWLYAEPYDMILEIKRITYFIPAAGGGAIVGGMRANSILGGGVYVA